MDLLEVGVPGVGGGDVRPRSHDVPLALIARKEPDQVSGRIAVRL